MNLIQMPEDLIPLDIYIESITKEQFYNHVEGRSGRVNTHSEFRYRNVRLELMIKAHDTQDYRLLRDEAYALFTPKVFYVIEKYQAGKRYKVESTSPFIPNRPPKLQRYATFTVDCQTVDLPFSESIGTTKNIEQNGINYNDELWGYGMGLLYNNESQKYKHNTKNFSIYNAGVEIHPFEQFLNIKISNASKNYELKNLTTGDKFKYTGDTTGTLELNGPDITMNNLQALRHTNKQFITLAKGWNEFEQSTAKEVEFDFRYYYL